MWIDEFDTSYLKVEEALGSSWKAAIWFETPNPLLGDVTPFFMLISGRGQRLLKFIDEQTKQNREI